MISGIKPGNLALFIFALSLPVAAFAQTNNNDRQTPALPVPFVACRNYAGNGGSPDGDLPATAEKEKAVRIDATAAKKLAYYGSTITGALAPRGWHCIGYSGSSGGVLIIAPRRIEREDRFDIIGPAVIVRMDDGTTSGRFGVAGVIARFFPAHKKFLENVISEGLEPAGDFPSGPYPADKMTYLNDSMVEIRTPPGAEGFGTEGGFKKNNYSISGAAIIEHDGDGQEGPQTLCLHIRLQDDKNNLTSQIMRQFEAE